MNLPTAPHPVSNSSTSLLATGDAPAGIHCANQDCRTRAGERSRGHQSCRLLLCGHCCQSAAKAAAEAGEQRPVCKVHARRLHTGHRPLPKEHVSHQAGPQQQQQQQQQQQTALQMEQPAVFEQVPDFQDLLERRARLEQSLKRSLTLVIWYRNGCEPLRIAHEVTTFPFFQLQDFPELVAELGLQPSAYIDVYNAESGLWEQHKISTVRTVGQDQRLLYRLRPSLLDSLTDCPSLDQELALQPAPASMQMKRQMETPPPSGGKQARAVPNFNPIHTSSIASPVTTQARTSPSASTSSGASPAGWAFAPTSTSSSNALPRTGAQSPAAKLENADGTRRWPTDYTVHAIAAGFDAMAGLVRGADGSPSAGAMRQKAAFEQVFAPCRYVKSTVGRAKLYWKRASPEIRAHFLALSPDDPRARWSQFVHLMDGRLVIELGKDKANDEMEKDDGGEEFDPRSRQPQPQPRPQPLPSMISTTFAAPQPTPLPALALPLGRQTTMPPVMPNRGPSLQPHASAPLLSMPPPPFVGGTDRGMAVSRSSNSLAGAMTIPSQ